MVGENMRATWKAYSQSLASKADVSRGVKRRKSQPCSEKQVTGKKRKRKWRVSAEHAASRRKVKVRPCGRLSEDGPIGYV